MSARIERLVAEVGAAQRAAKQIQVDCDAAVAKVKEEYAAKAKPHNDTITKHTTAIHEWAEANRDELLTDGKKTVTLATGELSWRTAPRSVDVRSIEKAIAKLQEKGLLQFIRTKSEINKEAILAEKTGTGLVEGITGLRITQGETFTIKPNDSDTEIAVPIKTKAVT